MSTPPFNDAVRRLPPPVDAQELEATVYGLESVDSCHEARRTC